MRQISKYFLILLSNSFSFSLHRVVLGCCMTPSLCNMCVCSRALCVGCQLACRILMFARPRNKLDRCVWTPHRLIVCLCAANDKGTERKAAWHSGSPLIEFVSVYYNITHSKAISNGVIVMWLYVCQCEWSMIHEKIYTVNGKFHSCDSYGTWYEWTPTLAEDIPSIFCWR